MRSKRILGVALASVAAGFMTIVAPTFAACGADHSHKATEKEGSKPITAEKGKPAPTVEKATKDKS
jgi:hypothetical protein